MIQRKSEKPLAIASIIIAYISALGLILLTIFDAFNHSTLHWTFALIFFVGLAISGILNLWEIGLLHKDHPESRLLKWSHRLKLVFIVLAVMCLIAMIVLMVVSMRRKEILSF
jgi:amino acid transporter